MRCGISLLMVLTSMLFLVQDARHEMNAAPNPRDVGSHYENAKEHRELAMKYLQEATDQNRAYRIKEAQAEFDRAAEEYIAYASIASNDSENNRISFAASGLLACYHATEALKLVLEHPDALADPDVMRIKAEALFALGLGKEAALAYEQWIVQGKCMGRFYRNWPGEPRLGDGTAELLPRAIHDSCAGLAPDLRARLEIMQRFFGHPNLPKKNYNSYPGITY
jgi:hypothetical protein